MLARIGDKTVIVTGHTKEIYYELFCVNCGIIQNKSKYPWPDDDDDDDEAAAIMSFAGVPFQCDCGLTVFSNHVF